MAANQDSVVDPFEQIEDQTPMARLLNMPRNPPAASVADGGMCVAELVAFDVDDRPVIRYRDRLSGERLTARTTVGLRRAQLGAPVAVMCEAGDIRRPIIIGVIEDRVRSEAASPAPDLAVEVDGERHVITAEREIVLRCGEASITLTRAGKVIIKGTYVVSRSSGYNKIKGAAIDIN